jgi:Tfp pilus assembly protein PilF
MARIRFCNRARKVVALGVALCSGGCAAFNSSAPRNLQGWNERGRQERISPAQQADVQISLARVAEQEGNVAAAEAGYRAALSRDKSRSDAHLHLANIQTLKGDYRRAAEEYQLALEANPGSAEVFCDMGYSLYLQRKWDDAERNLKQALVINSELSRAHNNLALVYAHTQRSELALAEFRKAGNSVADAHVNLAFSLLLQEQWPEARDQYRRALAAKPNSEVAKSRLRDIDRVIAAKDRQSPGLSPARERDVRVASVSASRPSQVQRPYRPEVARRPAAVERPVYRRDATQDTTIMPASATREKRQTPKPRPSQDTGALQARRASSAPQIAPPKPFRVKPSEPKVNIPPASKLAPKTPPASKPIAIAPPREFVPSPPASGEK